MSKYVNYLNLEERIQIERLLKQGNSNRQIAKALGRTRSPVNKEVRLNGGKANYNAQKADIEAKKRLDSRYFKLRREPTPEQISRIEELLSQNVPLNQIRKELGFSYFRLERYFKEKGLGPATPTDSTLVRLQNLEEQVAIILDILRSKK